MKEPPLSVKIGGLSRWTAETWKVEKLVAEAQSLEAEVERLRGEEAKLHGYIDNHCHPMNEALTERLDAYRAAVAELREAVDNAPGQDWAPFALYLSFILDKLPRDDA